MNHALDEIFSADGELQRMPGNCWVSRCGHNDSRPTAEQREVRERERCRCPPTVVERGRPERHPQHRQTELLTRLLAGDVERDALRVAHERHACVLEKTLHNGEVNAGTIATRRQVGVVLINGLAVKPDAGHDSSPAREVGQRHSHRAPSITDGSSHHASKICTFSIPRLQYPAVRTATDGAGRKTSPARAVLSPAICLPSRTSTRQSRPPPAPAQRRSENTRDT